MDHGDIGCPGRDNLAVFVLFPAVLVGFPVYQFTFDVPGYLPYSGRTDLVIASCRHSGLRIITIIRRKANAYIVLDCRCFLPCRGGGLLRAYRFTIDHIGVWFHSFLLVIYEDQTSGSPFCRLASIVIYIV